MKEEMTYNQLSWFPIELYPFMHSNIQYSSSACPENHLYIKNIVQCDSLFQYQNLSENIIMPFSVMFVPECLFYE